MGLREAYTEKAAAQLEEWQGWIANYKAVNADYWVKEPSEAQRLEDCYQLASVRVSELSSARGKDWEIAKEALEGAMIDLKRAIDESGVFRAGRSIRLQSNRHSLPVIFSKKS
jgi:hypothetical protein